MAGKSTFLKSIGIAVYLAHTGFPVPAGYMETTVFNGLVTTINLSDDINRGYSHYYSEVKRVKDTALKILEKNNILVIFDELFRGTNVKDAYEATLEVINALSKIRDCLFLVSTHITEIADKFEDDGSIRYNYFDSHLQNDEPVYDYKLKKGISSERLGMKIIQNEKIIDILKQAIERQSPR
jgi:DNA mismatch repair ATPase MutS